MTSATQAPPGDESTAPLEPVPVAPPRPTPKERLAEGKARRAQVARSAHADWQPPADRPDPVALLERSRAARASRS
jgi:hypothetical protein